MNKDKKELLMDAAEKLISEKGYYSTTIEDITKEAGVGKGSFYTYFKSKEEIVLEIFNNKNGRYEEEILNKVMNENIDIKEKIEKLTFAKLSFVKENQQFYHFIIKLRENCIKGKSNILKMLEEVYQKRIKMIMKLIYDDKKKNNTIFREEERLEEIIELFDGMVREYMLKKIDKMQKNNKIELKEDAVFLTNILFKGIE